jgi:hypothetical protein
MGGRAAGSSVKQRRSNVFSAGGIGSRVAVSSSSLAPAAWPWSDTRCPANISRRVTAHDHTSVAVVSRMSRFRAAAACSGDLYGGVIPPNVTVSRARASVRVRALARPKSVTLAVPSRASITFAGLTSWWTRPPACAWARPHAVCTAMSRTRARAGPA